MVAAADAVVFGGLTQAAALREYSVGFKLPSSTLSERVEKLRKGLPINSAGHPTTLVAADERSIADCCLFYSDLGWKFTRQAVRKLAREVAKERGLTFATRNGLPSVSWWKGFARRHAEVLKMRNPVHRVNSHRRAATKENLDRWFALLGSIIDEHKLPASRIWNCDETGMDKLSGQKRAQVVSRAEASAGSAGSGSGSGSGSSSSGKGSAAQQRGIDGEPLLKRRRKS